MLETGRHFLTDWYALQVTCPQDLEPRAGNCKLMPDVSSKPTPVPSLDALDTAQFLASLYRFLSIKRFTLSYGKT